MHEKSFKIDNIKFLWRPPSTWERYDLELGLGFGYMDIPGSRQRSFLKEMGWNKEYCNNTFPHYDNYAMEDVEIGSEHRCMNTDTQIVFMRHIFNSARGVSLPYINDDPYWIFHDSRHALRDVYGNEVDGITSAVEFSRLVEGADLAKRYKIRMDVKTLYDLEKAWYDRFGTNNFKVRELLPYLSIKNQERYWASVERGEYLNELDFQYLKQNTQLS